MTVASLRRAIETIQGFPECEIYDCTEDFGHPYFLLDFVSHDLYSGEIYIRKGLRVGYDGVWPQTTFTSEVEALSYLKNELL